MAIVKIHPIKKTPAKGIEYIVNPKKTKDGILVTGINTVADPKLAHIDMKNMRERYSMKRENKCFHFVHSFNSKDNITAEQSHEFTLDWCKCVFGDKAQYIVATHDDQKHKHTHIIVNNVNILGQSMDFTKTWLYNAKRLSNQLCAEYGLVNSITKQKPCRKRVRGHYEWDHIRNGTSYKEEIRNKIDSIIPVVNNKEELFSLLNAEGITFKEGKHGIMLKHPQAKRYMNFYALGNGYALPTLERYIRIYNKYPDTKYASKQYAKGILNAIDLISSNGKDLKTMNEELQRLKVSNDPLDKIRVKELSKEIRDTLEADRYLKSIHMSLEDRLKAKEELFKEIKPYKEKELER